MNRSRRIFVFTLALSTLIAGHAFGYDPDIFVPNLLRPVETEPKEIQINDPKAAMKIVAVRNGSFSGRVVIHQDYPVECPPVSMGELRLKEGDAVIPADAVQLRYGAPFYSAQPNPKYDTLSPTPQEEKNVIHAVWLVLQIPRDQAPGLYEGTLQCGDRKVPVTVKVIDWELPDPKDFVTFVDFIQSPESVALQYKVKLWSDDHFTYIGKSFEQMARVGCRAIYIHLAGRSNLGNEHTHGWRHTKQYSGWFPRDIWRAGPIKLPSINRMMAERNAGGGQNGFGRMSADFWFVLGKGKRRGPIASRFTSWSQLNLRMAPYFAPGPDGADNTYKFQMIVEGVQESEARIHIDRVLLDKKLRARIGEDMATRLQGILDDRARAIVGCYGNKKTKKKGDFNSYIEGWQERSEKLYTAAMELTAKLAAPAEPAPAKEEKPAPSTP